MEDGGDFGLKKGCEHFVLCNTDASPARELDCLDGEASELSAVLLSIAGYPAASTFCRAGRSTRCKLCQGLRFDCLPCAPSPVLLPRSVGDPGWGGLLLPGQVAMKPELSCELADPLGSCRP